ncbi:hypothetical protein CDD81_4662 [Ophiocordyceps australis]|uniref:Reverse transcriptase n=1 Tax=Ophiocordyceps australis TaxID=1399860 RepID=A0A2C5XUZ4_9HYPO|nr:hypothetical protein CDD81_4662 [Ophiocordyceps australis]
MLDEFCSAYMDDVLIYSSGSRADHIEKVRRVLLRLQEHGLHLDPDKCEFAVKKVKYLGFILLAGEGIQADPEKVEAIKQWEAPTSITGIRSFLGFANFYRTFIHNFSAIAEPLTALTGKGATFSWGTKEQDAFERLKESFCTAPILAEWDFDQPAILEADCSGWALGGQLSQEIGGRKRPVAFFSQKLSAAERNYPIHDKEMLAIIRCMEEWQAELRSCPSIQILTDHKNLEYFAKRQHLSERQARWNEFLSRFSNYEIIYRPGKEAAVPDALSRKDQDKPTQEDRDARFVQMIPPGKLRLATTTLEEATNKAASQEIQLGSPPSLPQLSTCPFADDELRQLWDRTIQKDTVYLNVRAAVGRRDRTLDPKLCLKVQIADCHIDQQGILRYRDRIWVPGAPVTTDQERKAASADLQDLDKLRGLLIQRTHDAAVIGHPGREGTIEALSRDYYWPLLNSLVRAFLRNCDTCGRTKIWRSHKQGLLKPLPLPEQFQRDLQMDFITDLPVTEKGNCCLWVIKDRGSRQITLEPMPTMEAEECAERFLWCHVRDHGWPASIVSDRGSNWTSRFWTHLCKRLGIKQLLSTAYHPQTDGGPERVNQEAQAYLRAVISYDQKDWDRWIPAAQLALNSRTNSSIGMSPFFANHGYHPPSPIAMAEVEGFTALKGSPEAIAQGFVDKLAKVTDLCHAMAASSAEKQENNANKNRRPAERFEVGDKVWLDLRDYGSKRPKKKLDWLHAKYTVKSVIGPQVVELEGLPSGIHPRFNVEKLRRASNDPVPGQVATDPQPAAIQVDGEDEFFVEKILAARWKKKGRGKIREVLVKWKGYQDPTWQPLKDLADNEAVDIFEGIYGNIHENNGDPQFNNVQILLI